MRSPLLPSPPNLQSTLCSFGEEVQMQGVWNIKDHLHSVKLARDCTLAVPPRGHSQGELQYAETRAPWFLSNWVSRQISTTQKGVSHAKQPTLEDFQMRCARLEFAQHFLCTIRVQRRGQAAPSASPFVNRLQKTLVSPGPNSTPHLHACGVPLISLSSYCAAVFSTAESLDPTVCHRS